MGPRAGAGAHHGRSYGFDVADARRVTLFADIFNVFNQTRTLDYDNWTELSLGVPNPDFGKPVSQNFSGAPQFQRPFGVRLGARLEF